MHFSIYILLSLLLAVSGLKPASAQYGVCSRAADHAVMIVNAKRQHKIEFVLRHNYPPHVIQAHLDIINYSHQEALNSIQQNYNGCARGYRQPQQIVDTAMFVFSTGLNRQLPPGMARIDISEIINGTPFGGPKAIVPQTREQILNGDRGTGANIVRDPIRCLTFQRKC